MHDDWTANSAETCNAAASKAGYSIFGLEYGVQCFVGNAFQYTPTIADGLCNYQCPGKYSSEICGARACVMT